MSAVGTHGGCFACGGGQGAVLWSTSDLRCVLRALRKHGRVGVQPPADSVALCPACFGDDADA